MKGSSPARSRRFFASPKVQIGRGAHRASNSVGNRGSFPESKAAECEADHSLPRSVDNKNDSSCTSALHTCFNGVDKDCTFHGVNRDCTFHGVNRDCTFHGVKRDCTFHGVNRDCTFHGVNRDCTFLGVNRDCNFHGVDKDCTFLLLAQANSRTTDVFKFPWT